MDNMFDLYRVVYDRYKKNDYEDDLQRLMDIRFLSEYMEEAFSQYPTQLEEEEKAYLEELLVSQISMLQDSLAALRSEEGLRSALNYLMIQREIESNVDLAELAIDQLKAE